MIPLVHPIKHIHVSGFNGSRSLGSRGISHARDYRFLQDRIQMPSWNPYCIPQESPEMVSSAYLRGSVSTASPPLSSVVRPSSPCVGPFPPPLHRLHRTTLLLDTRAASAPFFAPARRIRSFLCLPPSPPPHTMQVALHSRTFVALRSLIYCGTFIDVEEDRAPFSVGVKNAH